MILIVKTLLIVDSHAIIHRAFHAIPMLHSQSGMPTNAVYGFFAMIDKAIIDFQPTHLVTCFDTPKKTFRKELFEGYQSKRPPLQDDLRPQIQIIKDLVDSAKIARFEKEGFEADDVIGTITSRFKHLDIRILILTGDKDILQLVDDNVLVVTPQTGMSTIKIYNPEEVQNKFQIDPLQIPDYKALAGDSSDNYHAAKGIGPKTATKLLHQFQTIEKLYENINQLENEKVKAILMESKENVILFKQIATIVKDVELDCSIDDMIYKGFDLEMKEKLSEWQLYSLLKRFFNEKKPNILPKKIEEKPKDPDPQLGLF